MFLSQGVIHKLAV